MKLTVVLEKKSKFAIELPEEDAKTLYKSVIGLIVNALKVPQVIRINPKVRNIEPKEIVKEENLDEAPEQPITKSEAPSERVGFKKLIMLKCSGCNETLVGVANEGQWSLTCKTCKTNNTLEDLMPATYICPNCGYKANFYVKDGLDIVKCKNCDGDIDLIYCEKKEKYLSANLVK